MEVSILLNKTMLKLDFRIKRANIGKYRHLISKEILVGNTGDYLYFYNSPYAYALRLVNHCPIEVIVNENEHILLNSANDLEDMVNNINIDKKEEIESEITHLTGEEEEDTVIEVEEEDIEEESGDNTKVEDSIETEDGDSDNSPVEVNDEDDNIEEDSDEYTEEEEETSDVLDNNKPEKPIEEESKEKNIVLTLKKKS